MMAPPTAIASVASKGPGARAGNHSVGTGATAPGANHSRATIDAISPTKATRRYCMTATSLMSAPNASAISTMAVAAPGEEPQIAVVPGSTFQRARSMPSPAANAITVPIPIRKIGHCASIVAGDAAPMALAMSQPIPPCARMNDRGGIWTRPSKDATRIAPARAPSIKAAGSRMSSKAAMQTTEATRSPAHCRAGGVWRSVKCDIRSSGAKAKGVAVRYPGDAGKDIPHRRLMRLLPQARRHVARDDKRVAEVPRLPRRRLDADMRGDAAKHDCRDAPRLEFGIEVGAEEGAPGRLGDQNVAGLGEARSEIRETGRQDFGKRGRFVDLTFRPGKRRLDVDEHDRRARVAE